MAFHWYSGTEFTVIDVLVAVAEFAVQFPGVPHRTLPVVADRSVAQLIVIDDWIESVRYGYRVSVAVGVAAAVDTIDGSATETNATVARSRNTWVGSVRFALVRVMSATALVAFVGLSSPVER